MLGLSLFLCCACGAAKGSARALERANAYASAIDNDYETPEVIYDFLTRDIKSQIGRDEFIEAFLKERSYPYITPLYIFSPEVELSQDGNTGTVVYKQAARIDGMEYRVGLVYENGDYYIDDWRQLTDGSYLEKFEDCIYTLDWYYDPGGIKQTSYQ